PFCVETHRIVPFGGDRRTGEPLAATASQVVIGPYTQHEPDGVSNLRLRGHDQPQSGGEGYSRYSSVLDLSTSGQVAGRLVPECNLIQDCRRDLELAKHDDVRRQYQESFVSQRPRHGHQSWMVATQLAHAGDEQHCGPGMRPGRFVENSFQLRTA